MGEGDPVEIVDYDPAWPEMYAVAAAEIRAALAPWVVDVEHIGSTAVPGLAAKPVIDIMVGVTTLDAPAGIVAAMQALGYEYVAALEVDVPSRRYFRRWHAGRRTHQVHLVARDDAGWWDRHIAFRDWLRAHDDDRDDYAALKRSLAGRYGHDRVAYTDAKDEFVAGIVARA